MILNRSLEELYEEHPESASSVESTRTSVPYSPFLMHLYLQEIMSFADAGIPGLESCIYILSKPYTKKEGTTKVLMKNMDPLETSLDGLTTSIE